MKKIFIIGLALFGIVAKYSATNYTWTLSTAGVANSAASWSPNGIPGANDNVIFDGTSSSNCTWDIATVTSMSLMSGYTGVVNMGSTTHNIKQNLVINAGTLIATSGTLNRTIQGVTSSFILGGSGVFNHNNGVFALPLDGGDSYTFSGNIVLNTLVLKDASTNSERSIDFGSNLSVNTLSYSGSAPDPIAFQGSIHIKSSFNFSAANYTSLLTGVNTGNFIFDGTNVSIVGLSGAGMGWLPNVNINTSGTYSITNHLSITGNWTWTQGTPSIAGSTENFYGASATISGASVAFNDLAIQTGASVSLPANEVLISGSLTNSGTLNFSSAGSIGLNGTSAQSANLSGASITSLTCYGTGSRAITLSGTIDILDVLTVGNGVTLTTGGGMTLKANTPKKARLAPVGTGASITDNLTVELLIPAGATGWSMLGVPGVNGQTIADWDKYPTDPNGLPMTCHACTYDPSQAGSFYSIQGWDETTALGYDTLPGDINSGTALAPGKGFWVYAGNGTTTSTDIKLSNKGTLVTGPKSIAITKSAQAGFNLVANPYASPINWDDMYTIVSQNNGGVTATIYTFGDNGDSQLLADGIGGSGTGGFVGNSVLAAGQAFYVEATSASTTLELDEAGKSTTNTGAVFKPATTTQMFRLKIAGAADDDDELFRFLPNATPFFDVKYDAHKLFSSPGYVGYPGSYDKYTSISSKDAFDVDYAIHSMPLLTQSLSIPVLARVSAAGSYTISAYDFKNFTSCVGLMDKATNTFHDLRQSDYVFTINDSTAVPRFDLLLCRDANIDETSISQIYTQSPSIMINQDEQSPFVKMSFPQNTKATISVYNIMGQKLMEDITVEGTATTTRLNTNMHNQVALIRVVSDKESSTKKIVIH